MNAKAWTTAACAGALLCTALLSPGCRTAMRGAGYKRLISSYAESVTLTNLTERRLMEAVQRGDDPERIEAIARVRDEVTLLNDQWHDSLDRRRRETWHRTQMKACWDRYLDLFPEDRAEYVAHRLEHDVEIDEIRSRRTPLTHDQRFRRAPEPQDPLPYGRAWTPDGAPPSPAGDPPAPATPERTPEPAPTPAPDPEPAILIEPADQPDPTEEMLMELLEEQARNPRN